MHNRLSRMSDVRKARRTWAVRLGQFTPTRYAAWARVEDKRYAPSRTDRPTTATMRRTAVRHITRTTLWEA